MFYHHVRHAGETPYTRTCNSAFVKVPLRPLIRFSPWWHARFLAKWGLQKVELIRSVPHRSPFPWFWDEFVELCRPCTENNHFWNQMNKQNSLALWHVPAIGPWISVYMENSKFLRLTGRMGKSSTACKKSTGTTTALFCRLCLCIWPTHHLQKSSSCVSPSIPRLQSLDEPVKNSIIHSYDRPVPNSSFLGSISKEVECFIQLASHCSNHHPARRLKWRFQRVLQNVSPESKNLDCRVGIQLCLVSQRYIIKSEVAEPHVLPRSRCLRPELIAGHQTAPIFVRKWIFGTSELLGENPDLMKEI